MEVSKQNVLECWLIMASLIYGLRENPEEIEKNLKVVATGKASYFDFGSRLSKIGNFCI